MDRTSLTRIVRQRPRDWAMAEGGSGPVRALASRGRTGEPLPHCRPLWYGSKRYSRERRMRLLDDAIVIRRFASTVLS
jgi:hypothetical protein